MEIVVGVPHKLTGSAGCLQQLAFGHTAKEQALRGARYVPKMCCDAQSRCVFVN
jgi:hypothetical protein